MAKQVIPTYINLSRPLIPDGIHLLFYNVFGMTQPGSNLRPPAYEANALSTEPQLWFIIITTIILYPPDGVAVIEPAIPDPIQERLAGRLWDEVLVVSLDGDEHARGLAPRCQLPHKDVLRLVLVRAVTLGQHAHRQVRPLTGMEDFMLYF